MYRKLQIVAVIAFVFSTVAWAQQDTVVGRAPGRYSGAQPAADVVSPKSTAGFVERLEIKSVTDAYGGAFFGSVGPYRVISGIVHGKISPIHPANTGIVDIGRAPVGPDGFVAYTTDFVILRPKNPATAKRIIFYDVANRGNKLALGTFNGAGTSFEAGQQGDALLLREGYTIVWSGWQGDIQQSGNGGPVGANFPVAVNADGSSITGISREEVIFDNTKNPGSITLTYPAASLDPSQVTFNVRESWATTGGMTWDSPSASIPASNWKYVDNRHVTVTRPASMDAGAIYSFVYPAKEPVVMGIGFAAVRDLISFLRFDSADRQGTPNPLNDLKQAPCAIKPANGQCPGNPTTNIDLAIGEGISQSGRFVRDFLWQGFNDDVRGHKVFDGLLPIIPGSRKTYTNFRWSQPGRWSKSHEDHFQPGDQFPFTYAVTRDPVSGAADGLLKKCLATHTCPKIMQLDGAFELWGGRGSLLVTDGAGHEVPIPDNVRLYFVPGAQHGGGNGVGTERQTATCQNPSSAVDERTTDRALVPAMEAWLTTGTAPPASQYPTLAARTLALPDSRSAVGFPDLSKVGVTYSGAYNQLFVTNYSKAIPAVNLGKPYRILVPTTDADGNDISGVRVPDIAVPIATYTGWNLRKAGFAEGETCGSTGSTIPFATTAAARNASGDPRPSLTERYSSEQDYVNKVRTAAQALVNQRLLLAEDVDVFVKAAQKVATWQHQSQASIGTSTLQR
jgi:Alpha/beta hydrolase domain